MGYSLGVITTIDPITIDTSTSKWDIQVGDVNSNMILMFTSNLEMIQFDEYFSDGLKVNHQLGKLCVGVSRVGFQPFVY